MWSESWEIGPSRAVAVFLTVALGGCRAESHAATKAIPAEAPGEPRAQPSAPFEDDGQWTMAMKDYANLRFSKLSEVNAGNVGALRVAWTFSTGVLRGHEAPPLVVGDSMFVV